MSTLLKRSLFAPIILDSRPDGNLRERPVLVRFEIGQILRAGTADGSSALSAKRERINRYDFLEEGDDFAPSARCGRDYRVPSSKVMIPFKLNQYRASKSLRPFPFLSLAGVGWGARRL